MGLSTGTVGQDIGQDTLFRGVGLWFGMMGRDNHLTSMLSEKSYFF